MSLAMTSASIFAAIGTNTLDTLALSVTAAALSVRALLVSSLRVLILVGVFCFRLSALTRKSRCLLLPSPFTRLV